MNYEDIDTTLLRNSINQCLESINYSNSENILENISDNNIWNTSSRDTFKNALNVLVNEDYKVLEKKLKSFLEVADIIDKYKSMNQEIANSSAAISELEQKLQEAEDSYSIYKINNDLDSQEALDVQKIIESLNKEITEKNTKLESDNVELLKIKNSIEALMN